MREIRDTKMGSISRLGIESPGQAVVARICQMPRYSRVRQGSIFKGLATIDKSPEHSVDNKKRGPQICGASSPSTRASVTKVHLTQR